MGVEIRRVTDKNALHDFIFLPERIHDQQLNWVPPIFTDEGDFHNPKKNKALLYSDTVLFLAYQSGNICGRIMGIVNNKYNVLKNENVARFFKLDCIDDREVSHALIQTIEKWAIEKKIIKMIGPYGFSDKDPQGLQIEGFEFLPVIATPDNIPYLPSLVEAEGYQKEFDCMAYKLDIPDDIPGFYINIYNRVIQNKKLKLIEFTGKKQLKPFIVPVLRLMNETYGSLYGFVPLDEEEMFQLADKYLPLLDPEFTKIVVDSKNNPIAFVVSSPDFSEGIKRAKGRLYPFGFIHILLSARRTKQLDLFLGAVKETHRNNGLTAILGVALMHSAKKRKLKYMDSHLVLERNRQVRAIFEKLGGTEYKRYRIFGKKLIP